MAVLNALYRNGVSTCIDTRMADASGNGQGVWSQKPGVSRFDLIDTIFDSAYITENTLHLIIKSTNAPTTKKQVIFHGEFAGAEGELTSNQFKNTALTGFIKTVYEGDMNDPHSMREVLSGINLPFNNFIDATWETLFNGNDRLTGGSNDDYIYSYEGNDLLKGGGGNDTVDGGAGNDRMIGGDGTDTASYASATAAVTVSLALTTAQNTVGAGTDTLNTIENLTGSSFNDTLTGNSASNTLNGGVGADVMWGGAGNDTLDGGAGNDALTGGIGKDSLTGGLGSDVFYFKTYAELGLGVNADVIRDFNKVQADKIDVSLLDARLGATVNDSFRFLAVAPTTNSNANGALWYSNGVLYGSNDTDVAAEFQIFVELIGITTADASTYIVL